MELYQILLIVLVVYIAFIFAILSYKYWYVCNYKTNQGWHKCWKCKKAESTMYVSHTFFGKIYHCFNCSKS
jgi:hypothetical protein